MKLSELSARDQAQVRQFEEAIADIRVTRLLDRRDEIDREWAEMEEQGKLRYFGCSALRHNAWLLNIERINIVSRLMEWGIGE